MKAKTRKQKEVVKLSGELLPLTSPQIRWAFRTTHEHFAYRLKSGMATCMDCGHEWKVSKGKKCRCPKCGAHLQVKNTRDRMLNQKSYFNVITAKGEYQVIRSFILISEMRKGYKAKYSAIAICEYWIDPKGKKTLMGLCRTMNSYYCDIFNYCSPMEIRNENDAFRHVVDSWVYPRIKVTDTIRRTGFKTSTYKINPVTLFQQLLTNPKAETLMKAGQIELLRHLTFYPAEIDKYWDSIKIALRHGYEIVDAPMWFDYIKMLERMGKDLHSPALVAPKNLKVSHDEYLMKVERLRIKEQKEKDRERAEADEAKFEELKGKYCGLVLTDGEIEIHTLNSVAEYYNEGSRQHICVGSSQYYLKENSLVFTATLRGKTIATIEISLNDFSILQCRAFANGVCEYADRIARIIESNKVLIAERKIA